MLRTILAVSQGGPDAVTTFGLAKRVARLFGSAVDAFFVPAEWEAGVLGLLTPTDRRQDHAEECGRRYREILGDGAGNTYTAKTALAPLDALRIMGRCSDLLVLGRPGDSPNLAPDTVSAAIHDCSRAVLIAPPRPSIGPLRKVIVAWNGSAQAARAVHGALPFLAKADEITIVVVGATPEEVGAATLVRYLARHAVAASVERIDPGPVSARARGRALLAHTHATEADLLVMGAYGGGQLGTFLGVGGATGKVIASCRVPLLLAH